ncbi:MAG: hypothetical protein U5J96_01710 [Ignavibacteriaceae bacterium]|nr:hypothetical protein [Ignavibacteriaceae bacterium]
MTRFIGLPRDVTGTIVTTDGGNTWTQSSFTRSLKTFGVSCVHALNADIAFVVASTIYKTTNRGTTGQQLQVCLPIQVSFPNTIHFFDQKNGCSNGRSC